MITFNIQVFEDGMAFVTDYTLPDGSTVYKDINDPDRVGFGPLKEFEGNRAILNYSDGNRYEVTLSDISEEDIFFEESQKLD
jgi:hypothetical protein